MRAVGHTAGRVSHVGQRPPSGWEADSEGQWLQQMADNNNCPQGMNELDPCSQEMDSLSNPGAVTAVEVSTGGGGYNG